MNERVSNACRMTAGLFVGSVASYLSTVGLSFIPFLYRNQNLLQIVTFALGFASCGIIIGVALAWRRKERLALKNAALGFGSGFLISGVVCFLLDAGLRDLRNDYGDELYRIIGLAQFLFSFALAGALSAALTRGRLFSVINSTFSVAVGWTTIAILTSVLNEALDDYLLTAAIIYFTLFSVITGALLKLRNREVQTNYQDLLQPQA
jgi:hypothetical protein